MMDITKNWIYGDYENVIFSDKGTQNKLFKKLIYFTKANEQF